MIRSTVVSLLGWILFRRAFQDEPELGSRFATRFFLVMTILEIMVFLGILYALYRLVASGQA
jgi:F0F1-type ATP synthase membrane subunit c/vacuolar-type H+-ATPase subunit K